MFMGLKPAERTLGQAGPGNSWPDSSPGSPSKEISMMVHIPSPSRYELLGGIMSNQ
jgi:hypothetical protein